ncbi:hypothetical protein INS90_03155 [Trueperella pecoris]|uniref:Uncharacterized protein n=1 Tax=Trueperella pecoris TaxID=2733571 RepID=A0A7M1R3N7_9ACTO|nr:hypothetical protein [Trueperella pecoris]QOR48294.1 hypothetical protein INS90_03155 [Trueperella pecoris]
MGTLQRLFWRSTFNPLVVFAALILAFFAFKANSTERVILMALAIVLLLAGLWRRSIRRHTAAPTDEFPHPSDDLPHPSDDAEPSQE